MNDLHFFGGGGAGGGLGVGATATNGFCGVCCDPRTEGGFDGLTAVIAELDLALETLI